MSNNILMYSSCCAIAVAFIALPSQQPSTLCPTTAKPLFVLSCCSCSRGPAPDVRRADDESAIAAGVVDIFFEFLIVRFRQLLVEQVGICITVQWHQCAGSAAEEDPADGPGEASRPLHCPPVSSSARQPSPLAPVPAEFALLTTNRRLWVPTCQEWNHVMITSLALLYRMLTVC